MLTPSKLERLSHFNCIKKNYKLGHTIFKEGDKCEGVFMIIEGDVEYQRDVTLYPNMPTEIKKVK
jgi:CRP-like cAMP-binding protein